MTDNKSDIVNQNSTENEQLKVDYTEYESVSYAIIDSLNTIKQTEITGLEPLFNSIDLEAVDRLFEKNTNSDLIVEQMVDGYIVTIRGDGELTISESDYRKQER